MNAPAKLVLVLCLAAFSAALSEDSDAPQRTQPSGAFSPLNNPHLHNGHRVTDKVLSGAQPDGPKAFEALAAMGVKTIISVDGAKPDVQGAKTYGIRYVHLPIGYDRVEKDEGLALAKAMAELPGPIYVHCHHGKHRSAAAVAVACVQNGSLRPELAESVLKTFGTGENYVGLWRSAREARPLDPLVLGDLKVELPETAAVPPLAEAMVFVDHRFDNLKLLRKSQWKPTPEHPDLDAAHEALQLHEHLTELARAEAAAGKTPEYLKLVDESRTATQALRDSLAATPLRVLDARDAMTRLARSCAACHSRFRD